MSVWLKDPMVEMVSIKKTINPGDEVGLTNPETTRPVTFHPKVTFCNDQTLGLELQKKLLDIVKVNAGSKVQLTKVGENKIFYVEGVVESIADGPSPVIVVKHPNKILCAQRRLFYRFNLRKNFVLSKIQLPDGKTLQDTKVSLQDMSPSGIGFKSTVKLPNGTRFETKDLFDPVISDMEKIEFFLEVIWYRGNRCGAVFKFPSEREQDSFSHVLSQLQINRLAWYYQKSK